MKDGPRDGRKKADPGGQRKAGQPTRAERRHGTSQRPLGRLDTPDGPVVVRHLFPMSGTCAPQAPLAEPSVVGRPERSVRSEDDESVRVLLAGRPLVLRAGRALFSGSSSSARQLPAARLGAPPLARDLGAPGFPELLLPPAEPDAPHAEGARRGGRGESAGILGSLGEGGRRRFVNRSIESERERGRPMMSVPKRSRERLAFVSLQPANATTRQRSKRSSSGVDARWGSRYSRRPCDGSDFDVGSALRSKLPSAPVSQARPVRDVSYGPGPDMRRSVNDNPVNDRSPPSELEGLLS